MNPPFENTTASRMVVLGHPNHELAIYGFLQRTRPRVLVLTDGGGPQRVADTRRGLEAIGLLDHAEFLGFSEDVFYGALLRRDGAFFRGVADAITDRVRRWSPAQVFCESIEYYNPVHDVTLPMVLAATSGCSDTEVVEFPLIYERAGHADDYVMQRVPPSRRARAVTLRLTDPEVALKLDARRSIYRSLHDQMGGLLDGVAADEARIEQFVPASAEMPAPDVELALRYERRGRALQQSGAVKEVITFREHFLPTMLVLNGGSELTILQTPASFVE